MDIWDLPHATGCHGRAHHLPLWHRRAHSLSEVLSPWPSCQRRTRACPLWRAKASTTLGVLLPRSPTQRGPSKSSVCLRRCFPLFFLVYGAQVLAWQAVSLAPRRDFPLPETPRNMALVPEDADGPAGSSGPKVQRLTCRRFAPVVSAIDLVLLKNRSVFLWHSGIVLLRWRCHFGGHAVYYYL